MDIRKKSAVVISSCDAYRDAWGPFFALFFKYWPDCPFEIYLISNACTYSDARVKPTLIEKDGGWASNMSVALEKINTPYILYLQEDYFLEAPVKTDEILTILEEMSSSVVGYARLVPFPKPDLPFNTLFGEISSQSLYRVSLQAALWNVSVLKKLMVQGETGWDMEKNGTIRSASISQKFISAKKNSIFPYNSATAIKKGKWIPYAIRLCHREGVIIDTSHRQTFSMKKILKQHIRRQGMRFLSAIGLLQCTKIIFKKLKKCSWRKMKQRRAMKKFYASLIPAGSLCFDVGANLGNRTDIFLVLGGSVVAIEPQKLLADRLIEKYSGNQRVQIENSALGAYVGEGTLMQSSAHTITSMSPEWIEKVKASGRFSDYVWGAPVQVSIQTLDVLIAKYGLPAFCKIDVEGFEYEVLKGLRTAIPRLSFEFTPEFNESTLSCIKHLDSLGAYEFNYSLGETMIFVQKDWIDSLAIQNIVKSFDGSKEFGDVYARLK